MEKREAKLEEFIYLHHRGMSVKEYSLKFIKMSKYALSLVSKARDEKNSYLMGVSKYLEEEYHVAMLHNNIDLSRLMVHAQHVEESRVRRSNRESKKSRYFKSGSSKS